MDEERIKSILLTMTDEIYKTIRLLAEENSKLQKRVEVLEKKLETTDTE